MRKSSDTRDLLPMNARCCVVFAPHEDDATLACGGMIRSRVRTGAKVSVVCMTDGRHSHLLNFGIKENPTPLELKKLRELEEKEALTVLGVPTQNVKFLEFEDGLLYNQRYKAKACVGRLLEKLRPAEVFVPYRDDKHPDHMAAYLIVSQSIHNTSVTPTVYEYFIWAVPPLTAKRGGAFLSVDLSRELLEAKTKAISQYRSQTGMLCARQPRPVLTEDFLKRFVKGKETFLLTSSLKDSAWTSLTRTLLLWFKSTLTLWTLYYRKYS